MSLVFHHHADDAARHRYDLPLHLGFDVIRVLDLIEQVSPCLDLTRTYATLVEAQLRAPLETRDAVGKVLKFFLLQYCDRLDRAALRRHLEEIEHPNQDIFLHRLAQAQGSKWRTQLPPTTQQLAHDQRLAFQSFEAFHRPRLAQLAHDQRMAATHSAYPAPQMRTCSDSWMRACVPETSVTASARPQQLEQHRASQASAASQPEPCYRYSIARSTACNSASSVSHSSGSKRQRSSQFCSSPSSPRCEPSPTHQHQWYPSAFPLSTTQSAPSRTHPTALEAAPAPRIGRFSPTLSPAMQLASTTPPATPPPPQSQTDSSYLTPTRGCGSAMKSLGVN